MIWMLALALVAAPAAVETAAAAQGEPTPQALELGVRLARSGSLAAIAPMLADRDVEDVIKAHPEWTAGDAAVFRATARRVATADIARLVRALGHAYARRLSIADLAYLVNAVEGPAATRRRAIEAPVLVEALQTVGAIDFKHDTLAAFCAEMGKGCPAR